MASFFEVKLAMDEYEDGASTWLVTVPAFPEITTYGDSQEEALRNARGAIEEAISARMSYGEELPVPVTGDDKKGYFVELDTMALLKSAFYEFCRLKNVSRAELARRMGKHRQQIDRLFDLNHQSRIGQFDDAAKALGVSLSFSVDSISDVDDDGGGTAHAA